MNAINQDGENRTRNELVFSEPETVPMHVDQPPPSPIMPVGQNPYNLQIINPLSNSTLQESREPYNESTVLEDQIIVGGILQKASHNLTQNPESETD